ncbi:hypothetical protein ACFXKF_36590 [Streptomyces scopuliridis]|uniref:hypothetical protein n=1 Tax=Streptomyces scopuliridis TaxID=452529 RepID=UPI003695C2D8
MARTRLTTTDLHNALHAILDENPLRADDGHPEYRVFVYHGRPTELNVTLMHGFGASLNPLKALDSALDGTDREWEHVKHPLRNRFTPLAWTCLSHLGGGDPEGAWANSHRLVFGPRATSLGRSIDRSIDRRRRPWLYDSSEFAQTGSEHDLHPGCSVYPVPDLARHDNL